jgi:2C-methyl-D-erythritol 2,4-cyclodiphosphate synthase
MSLAETRTEYDDAASRKALAKAIKAHQSKAAELTDLRAAIDLAQIKLASMQEAIDGTANVEDAVAELAAA